MKYRDKSGLHVILVLFALAALFTALAVLTSGCDSTVAPAPIKATTASFDGNVQNSGLIGYSTNSTTQEVSAIVTEHWRDRYNAFIDKYGKEKLMTVHDTGLTLLQQISPSNATWLASKQARSYFAEWNAQSKAK